MKRFIVGLVLVSITLVEHRNRSNIVISSKKLFRVSTTMVIWKKETSSNFILNALIFSWLIVLSLVNALIVNTWVKGINVNIVRIAVYDACDLIDPRRVGGFARFEDCSERLEIRDSAHLFLRLDLLQPDIEK